MKSDEHVSLADTVLTAYLQLDETNEILRLAHASCATEADRAVLEQAGRFISGAMNALGRSAARGTPLAPLRG